MSESQEEWRKRVLAEANRLRTNLAAAKQRREAAQSQPQEEPATPVVDQADLDELEEAHKQVKKRKGLVLELQKQALEWKRAEALEESQLAKLELAEKALEETNKRLAELAKEVENEEPEEDNDKEGDNKQDKPAPKPAPSIFHDPTPASPNDLPVTGRAVAKDGPDDLVSQSYIDSAEETWKRLARNTSVYQELKRDGMWSAREGDAEADAEAESEGSASVTHPEDDSELGKDDLEYDDEGQGEGGGEEGAKDEGEEEAAKDEGEEEAAKDEGEEEAAKDEGEEEAKEEGKEAAKEEPKEEPKEEEKKEKEEKKEEAKGEKKGEKEAKEEKPKQEEPKKEEPVTPKSAMARRRPMTEQERLQQMAEKRKTVFLMPAKPVARAPKQADFQRVLERMTLHASPLIFFNLACFQADTDGDVEVMHPICGYAQAATLLAVMGPPGTNTSTLRSALSSIPNDGERNVYVADFNVKALLYAADHVLRKDEMDRSKPLEEILGLEDAAEVVIGTCIQRGEDPNHPELGTPRGSRNPDAPTPRNARARCIPGSQASLHKSVLLLEDLSVLLKPDELFKVVRVLKKVTDQERAAAIVTLTRPFERRGLSKLFDDVLLFSDEGVCYYGPAKYMSLYCSLIGSPVPKDVHVTDHILRIPNITAKYHASPVRMHVGESITKYTQRPPDADTPQRLGDRKAKSKSILGLPKLRRKRRKAKEEQLPDGFEEGSSHAMRLAARLEEERRKLAEAQAAAEKMQIWAHLASLDGDDAFDGSRDECPSFEHLLLHLQQASKRSLPSCFMNLACFINTESWPTELDSAVVQPTVAFASEGQVLGIVGPGGIDATNLLMSLRFGSDLTTVISDLSVKDTLRMAEFVNEEGGTPQSQEIAVHLLMAKMMLTACAREVVGTMIQRTRENAPKKISIGDKVFSTATRSILILDQITALDAQSLFVVLKLIKLIAAAARLAVVVLTDKYEEQQGLMPLFDNALVFSEEGVFFFGPARHLRSYCRLVDLPAPKDKPIVEHVREMMAEHSPSKFDNNPDNLNTPFTTRFEHSALAKYNKRIIEVATKPADQGGHLTARMMIPKTFRRLTSRHIPPSSARERAEERRKRLQAERESEKRVQRESEAQSGDYEQSLKALTEKHPELVRKQEGGLHAGLRSIADAMADDESRPTLFFNLASFLPDVETERIDVFQPICGYAMMGRVVGLMGSAGSDVSSFVQAMAAPVPGADKGPSSSGAAITVKSITDIGTAAGVEGGDLGDKLKGCEDVEIGTVLRRSGDQPANAGHCILVLDNISKYLSAEQLFAVLSYIKLLGPRAEVTAIVHLKTKAERRGLYPLLDDCMLYDENGLSYFGPAPHLYSYLVLSGFSVEQNEHPTDAMFRVMDQYSEDNPDRNATDTSPAIRFRYSPLAAHVNHVAEQFTGISPATQRAELRENMEQALEEEMKKKKPIMSLGKKKQKADRETEAALRRLEIAESEAERERQRVAEADAEGVWKRMDSS